MGAALPLDVRDELLARIAGMWAAGDNKAAIAAVLGISLNAVVGLMFRARKAGDPRFVHRTPPPPKTRRARKPGIAPLPDVPLSPVHIVPPRVCQWPSGDPRDRTFRLCGAPVATPGRSYCAEHCEIAFVPVRRPLVAIGIVDPACAIGSGRVVSET